MDIEVASDEIFMINLKLPDLPYKYEPILPKPKLNQY